LTEAPVSFPTEDGLLLEGLLARGKTGRGCVILCHPHPQYGGDMQNNVVRALQRSLTGGGFSTLRFNFRGVGGSAGSYADGLGEEEDVRGAVRFAAEQEDCPIFLAGYSFGAAVGAKEVMGDERVGALVCVSPPVEMYDFSFLNDYERPKLLVAGDRDFVCPVKPLETLFASLPQPKAIQIIPGADHFWGGMEGRVADCALDFLQGL
jgi:alpha/beta superfamily hydrolase